MKKKHQRSFSARSFYRLGAEWRVTPFFDYDETAHVHGINHTCLLITI
jgi:hypothetical protein